jgi:pimeloyl-ACP methyl ester carboxylesterase
MPTIDVNGHTLFYADHDFSDPWRIRDVVFLQPYIFGSHDDFRAWVPCLSGHLRVLRLDRYGLGGSAVPDRRHRFTLDAVLDDFEATLDSLDIESVHFVGESLGGVFGAAFAARNPERVSTLVLCSTPRRLPDDVQRKSFLLDGYRTAREAVEEMGTECYFRKLRVAERLSSERQADREKCAYRVQLASRTAPHVVAGMVEMVAGVDITPLLPRIKAPTLLISPARSSVSSLADQLSMAAEIPDARQVVLDSEHHIAWFEADRCADEALKFIRVHGGY